MSAIIKFGQPPVPPEFAATMRQLRQEDSDRLNSLLLLANSNGWNLKTLGNALGISTEAVRQRVIRAEPDVGLPPIPPPPRQPTPMPKPDRRLRLKPQLIEDLREMQAIARAVNGGTAVNSPARRVSEQFSAQLAAYVEQGVTVYYLAQQLGVTHYAIYSRLARHGYRPPAPSTIGTPSETYKNRRSGLAQGACNQGHPMDGDNLRISQPSGVRICRACERRRKREYLQRRSAART